MERGIDCDGGGSGKLSLNCMVHAHVMLRSSPDGEVFEG